MRHIIIASALTATLGCSRPPDIAPTVEQLKSLKASIIEQRIAAADGVDSYRPKAPDKIEDITSPAVDILRSLPGVVAVEIPLAAKKPAQRIIHILDWHYVRAVPLEIDIKQQTGRDLTKDEFDRLYEQHLGEVEAVQAEQAALFYAA